MKHKLQISISDKPQHNGCVACKKIMLRERIVRMLLGKRQKFMVLIPGDTVKEVAVTKIPEGGRP